MIASNTLPLAENSWCREGTPFAQAYGTYLASDRHSANVVVNIF